MSYQGEYPIVHENETSERASIRSSYHIGSKADISGTLRLRVRDSGLKGIKKRFPVDYKIQIYSSDLDN